MHEVAKNKQGWRDKTKNSNKLQRQIEYNIYLYHTVKTITAEDVQNTISFRHFENLVNRKLDYAVEMVA